MQPAKASGCPGLPGNRLGPACGAVLQLLHSAALLMAAHCWGRWPAWQDQGAAAQSMQKIAWVAAPPGPHMTPVCDPLIRQRLHCLLLVLPAKLSSNLAARLVDAQARHPSACLPACRR
ncbi:hypothetical protein ABPG75_002088 [Micractinium tetrahymenae]